MSEIILLHDGVYSLTKPGFSNRYQRILNAELPTQLIDKKFETLIQSVDDLETGYEDVIDKDQPVPELETFNYLLLAARVLKNQEAQRGAIFRMLVFRDSVDGSNILFVPKQHINEVNYIDIDESEDEELDKLLNENFLLAELVFRKDASREVVPMSILPTHDVFVFDAFKNRYELKNSSVFSAFSEVNQVRKIENDERILNVLALPSTKTEASQESTIFFNGDSGRHVIRDAQIEFYSRFDENVESSYNQIKQKFDFSEKLQNLKAAFRLHGQSNDEDLHPEYSEPQPIALAQPSTTTDQEPTQPKVEDTPIVDEASFDAVSNKLYGENVDTIEKPHISIDSDTSYHPEPATKPAEPDDEFEQTVISKKQVDVKPIEAKQDVEVPLTVNKADFENEADKVDEHETIPEQAAEIEAAEEEQVEEQQEEKPDQVSSAKNILRSKGIGRKVVGNSVISQRIQQDRDTKFGSHVEDDLAADAIKTGQSDNESDNQSNDTQTANDTDYQFKRQDRAAGSGKQVKTSDNDADNDKIDDKDEFETSTKNTSFEDEDDLDQVKQDRDNKKVNEKMAERKDDDDVIKDEAGENRLKNASDEELKNALSFLNKTH